MTALSIIAAVAHNGVIGRKGRIPWYLPSELGRFMCITNNSPIIMGRRTFESIGHPLPDRMNIVMTKDLDFKREGIIVAHSLAETFELAKSKDGNESDEIFIIGGEKLYKDTIDLASRIYLTSIMADEEGDVFFPKIDFSQWHVIFSRYFSETIPHHFTIIEKKDAVRKIEIHSHLGCSEAEQDILGRAIPASLIIKSQDSAMMAEVVKYRKW